MEHRLSCVGAQIESDRALVQIEALEEQAVVIAEEERPCGAGGIAPMGSILMTSAPSWARNIVP
jgi:hypothetical protein